MKLSVCLRPWLWAKRETIDLTVMTRAQDRHNEVWQDVMLYGVNPYDIARIPAPVNPDHMTRVHLQDMLIFPASSG